MKDEGLSNNLQGNTPKQPLALSSYFILHPSAFILFESWILLNRII